MLKNFTITPAELAAIPSANELLTMCSKKYSDDKTCTQNLLNYIRFNLIDSFRYVQPDALTLKLIIDTLQLEDIALQYFTSKDENNTFDEKAYSEFKKGLRLYFELDSYIDRFISKRLNSLKSPNSPEDRLVEFYRHHVLYEFKGVEYIKTLNYNGKINLNKVVSNMELQFLIKPPVAFKQAQLRSCIIQNVGNGLIFPLYAKMNSTFPLKLYF